MSPFPSLPRALIVDDSPTQALDIRMRLARYGFEVQTATNGAQALELIQQTLPTVVLTDLNMPEMDGLELVKILKISRPGLPVILLTAEGSEEIAVKALRAGAASYVPKKNLDRDLPRTMENVLAIARASRGGAQLASCLTETRSTFRIPNDGTLIAPMIGRLQANLKRMEFANDTTLTRIGMALRESLVNATEHGNLEVSSKLREIDDGSYEQLVKERRQESPYKDRQVFIVAEETRAQVTYVIRDEGPGFDPAKLPDPTDPENLEKVSGRGLLLIHSFMDEVKHNSTGNEIVMVKRRDSC